MDNNTVSPTDSNNQKIDSRIKDIDKTICENISFLEFDGVSRATISQNLLGQSRNLVEHISVKISSEGKDIDVDWDTIRNANDYIKRDNKYLFLREFHAFLQESKSHYTPDNEGAERLILKYYRYYLQLKNFMKTEYQMDILENLERFPVDTDKSVLEYHEKIAACIDINRPDRNFADVPRMYVQKVVPFVVDKTVYYEIILTPAYDTTSKFDRFICYSSVMVPAHYSIKADIYHEEILVSNKKMPISILTAYTVSIRPCELNNFAGLFGYRIKMSVNHSEYNGIMSYLSVSGISLLEVVTSSDEEYKQIKTKMFKKSQVHHFENVLDKSRKIILSKEPGANIIRYILHTMNNKVIKMQYNNEANWKLSNLWLQWGCIPFDEMPFASSLIQHNPNSKDLFESIESDGRECEFIARYIRNNMNVNSRLYTPIKDIEEYTDEVDNKIKRFNSKLYESEAHQRRRIEEFGHNLYIKGDYDDTKLIIGKLVESSKDGVLGFNEAIDAWIDDIKVDSEEKRDILRGMFTKSHVALIYGAAGTGKTYIINHISQFFDGHDKLFLANTNPAVENLRRKVNAQNCEFMTITKYLVNSHRKTDYDILIIDECSMVCNSDMAELLKKVNYNLLILVGDTYQIESISFGNWFSMARYFIPRYAWSELVKPYRTDDKGLLDFWGKVRNLDNDLTEYIVNHKFASNLDASIFNKKADDEIILCLNYDGLYGINNINRFLQKNNPSKQYRWGLWVFKIGDPILFNDSERFMPVLYNNLKGKIVNIETDESNKCLWFSVEVDKALTELDVKHQDLELLQPITPGKSIVRFKVTSKNETDDDNESVGDSDIPFQIAYAVSIHKAQGLEYDSVKVVITRDVDELITHNIFYTAITRAKKHLKIYWSPETQQSILPRFEVMNAKNDATVFAAQSKMKLKKI